MLYKGYEKILHSSQIVESCSSTLSELAIFGVMVGIRLQKNSKAGFGQTLEKIVCTL